VAAERYTANLTGLLSLKKPGEYLYVRMDDNPLGSGGYTLSRGRPPYTELGRAASFEDLPEGCKYLVLDMYQKMWNLSRYERRFQGHIGWCQRTQRRLSWT
jgi:hypothetical protein